MEIERKFLISALPSELKDASWVSLRQGYLAVGPDGEVRIRDARGTYTLTSKSGSGIARDEHEVAITPAQFDALWPATLERRIEKRRATIPVGDLRYEIDVFTGALQGLVIAEVEFESLDAARAFEPPEWLGEDVTDNPGYTNASLAIHGVPGPEVTAPEGTW